ncbi:pentapeptide repeat-containing protein [Salinispora fenicalii]|uniref:pentapeptide repeat-containing protein n=1 Tax=Salinispora fenicalii TaxID=1137263 RepID=UPI0012BC611A
MIFPRLSSTTSDLTYVYLNNASLNRANLSDVSLTGMDPSEADLCRVSLALPVASLSTHGVVHAAWPGPSSRRGAPTPNRSCRPRRLTTSSKRSLHTANELTTRHTSP